MTRCKSDCLFNIDGKCTKHSKKDMIVIGKWKNDFKGFISELSIPEDDFYGIMEYIDEVPNESKWIPVSERLPTKEEYIANNGLFIVSDGNRTYAEYFDVYCSIRFGEPTTSGFRVDRCVVAWMPLPKPYEPQESEEV